MVENGTTVPPLVIKLGGQALESPEAARELAQEIASLAAERRVLVVHGGGHDVSDWSRRLGLTPQFHEGLRVTDEASLEVATAVLAGLRNKELVALLREAGVDAIGLSACDGELATLEPHPESATLGRVGRVVGIRAELLQGFLETGLVPVLASVGAQGGTLWNVNADELAGAVARAMGATNLIFLSDTPGVLIAGEVVREIDPEEVPALLAHPDVQGGMLPKLRAAASAVRHSGDMGCITRWSGAGSLRRAMAGTEGTCIVTKQHEYAARGSGA